MATREGQLKHTLTKDFGDLFEEETKALIIPKTASDPSGEKNIYLPESNMKGGKSLPLIDGVGSITIQETVNKDGIVIAYVYRFLSNEYLYSTYRLSDGYAYDKKEAEAFSFHYDRVINNTPHEPHVTIGYPTIRYISKEIKLDEFLSFVRDTFFSYETGKLKAKKHPIWANRA